MARSFRFHRDAERLFEGHRIWYRFLSGIEQLFSFRPRVEVIERDDVHVVVFDLPGVNKEDLDVRVDDHHLLTVSGERRRESDWTRGMTTRYSERRYGTFARTIELPRDGDAARMIVDFHEGILTIHVPKLEASRARAYQVGVRDATRSAASIHAAS